MRCLLSDCGDEMVKRCRNGEKAHNPEVCPLGDGELSLVQLLRLSSLWQLPAWGSLVRPPKGYVPSNILMQGNLVTRYPASSEERSCVRMK